MEEKNELLSIDVRPTKKKSERTTIHVAVPSSTVYVKLHLATICGMGL
jgi:hypothetical protein